MSKSLQSVGAFLLLATTVVACGTAAEEPATGSTEAAYSGKLPTLEPMDAPKGVPASWEQPGSQGLFNNYGYCGATAAANLLRWYQREVSPQQAIDDGCWSSIGTLPSEMGKYFRNHNADLECDAYTLPKGNALEYVKAALMEGKPLVVQFMTGSLNAHWVTIFGVTGKGDDLEIEVESWGGYYTMRWSDFEPAWKSAWGGPYPHVICDQESPLAEQLDTRVITGAGDFSDDTGSAGGGGDYGGDGDF